MQKIPSIFKRDYEATRLCHDEVVEGCEWVLAGEGVATIKWDGTCCMVRGGVLYRRHALKRGKTMPAGWEHWSGDPEQKSGHGWRPVGEGPEDQWHRQAWENYPQTEDGTYELIGERIQRDPYGMVGHTFRKHGAIVVPAADRSFSGLLRLLRIIRHEGLVFHHPDGRMAKVKRRDFGFPWPGPGRRTSR
ncbi:hypothetical protein CMI37_09455 [Candidatus Pacearchaeota archaeon]|nr:hypothetical protein [Candidatus Pacearchaeota archaeon]|tara:strand:- start:7 stop:576 length:570 start_codon:yes stop_codon:yes gene_type:complete